MSREVIGHRGGVTSIVYISVQSGKLPSKQLICIEKKFLFSDIIR